MELVKWLGLALALLLGPVILIHELGHFLSARRAGVRVLEFGLGFPPRLLTLAWGRGTLEVEGVRMDLPPRLRFPSDLELEEQVEVLARREEDGTFRVLRVTRTDAPAGQTETPQGLRLRGHLTALEPGTRYSLNLLPLGGFVRLLGEEDPSDPSSLAAQSKRRRLGVLLSGSLSNLLAAFILIVSAYVSGVPTRYFVQVDMVVPDTPAEAAGLLPGDIVLAVDGQPLEDGPGELREWILASPEQAVALSVLRAGQERALVATPRLEEGHGFLGIAMQLWPDASSLEHYSPPRAVRAALDDLGGVFVRMFRLPGMVAAGEVQPSEVRPSGLPGILQVLALALKQSLDWGIAFPALQFTALISLALGLTNLLPIPAFDGGRVLFVVIEAVRGQRISPDKEAMVHMVGMLIMLALFAVIMVQDIVSPIVPWSLLNR
jgi:regulator of sigma E protease